MKQNKGFSLVELIVVIAIMAILVGVAVPVYTSYIDKAQEAKDAEYLANVSRAAQIFAADKGLELKSVWIAPIVTENQGIDLYLSDGSRYTELDELYAIIGTHEFATAKQIQEVKYYDPDAPEISEVPGTQEHSHNFSVTKSATCLEDGWKKCECGKTQRIPAVGHIFDENNVVHIGNLDIYTCTVPGCGYQAIKANGNLIGG